MLAGHVLTGWKLPSEVCRAVAWHHQPGRAYAQGGDVGLMVALLRLADLLDRPIATGAAPDLELLENVGSGADATYAGLDTTALVRAWPGLVAERREALAVLGGA